MTRGVSLHVWDQVGMFEREVALYRWLLKSGVKVSFISWGDRRDLEYSDRINGIRICCNRWGLKQRHYEKLMLYLHWHTLWRTSVIKTNQMNGAEQALRCARFWKKPLIARCGYMWSEFCIREKGSDDPITQEALRIENNVFPSANQINVTTNGMRGNLVKRFEGLESRINVIPNYVDTDCFSPVVRKIPHNFRLLFVGRLHPQKNLEALINVVHDLDLDLEIIGNGSLEYNLKERAANNSRISFKRRVPNDQLPDRLCSVSVFILPSLYEGHPKTLIEAMSCGLPCIATDVSGNQDVIKHGETGWLCGTDETALREAIITLKENPALRERLGKRARQFVVDNYALNKIVKQELDVYQKAIAYS